MENKDFQLSKTVNLSKEKELLIEKIKNSNNPVLLQKIEKVLDEAEEDELVGLYDEYLNDIIYKGDDANEPCEINVGYLPDSLKVDKYEKRMAFPIFVLAMIMLALAGSIILLLTGGKVVGQFAYISGFLFKIYSIIWIFFVIDFIVVCYLAVKERAIIHKGEFIFRLCSLIFPPLRTGSRHITNSNYIWLPFWNWSKANYSLFDKLRRVFSLPMIIIALFIIPVLIVDWKFYDHVSTSFPEFNLDLWLQLVQAFIWIAFTFEFILMFSVTNEKADYCKRNWIDLLIIFLPLISFFRTLRLIQIARLNHLAKSYKLRGILMKAKQGLVLMDALQRIIYPNPKIHIRSLHKRLGKNRREKEEINRQILLAAERLKKKKKP